MVRRLKIGVAVLAILSGSAIAGHNSVFNNGEDVLIEFSSDKPLGTDHHLTDELSFGAKIEVEYESEINFDLDDAEDADTHEALPKFNFALAYEPSAALRAFAEFSMTHNFILDNRDDADEEFKLNLKEAYVSFRDVEDDITLTVGRHYRSDEREWLFDEEIDGAELVLRHNAQALELSYGRERLVRRDLLREETSARPDYFVARGFTAIGDDSQLSAFAIYQDGHRGRTDEDLWFLGVQSFGELGSHIDFWADGAVVIGESRRGRDVFGFGFDLGVTKTFKKAPMRPYLTAGVAFGSGDDGSGTDTAFRQTDLRGNSGRFGGVTSLHYYGEVLDPELSNLGILTLGVGFRPTRRSSVDLVYHHYIQDRRDDDFRDVAIDEDPAGFSKNIGDELDVVVGLKQMKNVDIELVGGVFFPGSAFEERDPAFFGGMTFQIKF